MIMEVLMPKKNIDVSEIQLRASCNERATYAIKQLKYNKASGLYFSIHLKLLNELKPILPKFIDDK